MLAESILQGGWGIGRVCRVVGYRLDMTWYLEHWFGMQGGWGIQ